MPSVTYSLAFQSIPCPDAFGTLQITIKGGDGGAAGANDQLGNAPFCDTPQNSGYAAGNPGNPSTWDTAFTGPGAAGDGGGTSYAAYATPVVFTFQPNHYR